MDWTQYYQKVLANPTATPEAKAEAKANLGMAGASLEGTMEEVSPGYVEERTLPTEAPGNLSVFKDLMKQITDKYSRASTMTGFGAATGILGVKPEAISGRSLAGIVDFVKGQTAPGIADIYTSTINMMEETRRSARENLNLLLQTKAFSGLPKEQLGPISEGTGIPYEQLFSIWNSQQVDELSINAYVQAIESGKMDIASVPMENRTDVLQRVDWSKVSEVSPGVDEYNLGGVNVSDNIYSVLVGGQELGKLTPAKQQEARAEMTTKLGLHLEEVQGWFKPFMESAFGITFTDEEINNMWKELRVKIGFTKEPTPTESGEGVTTDEERKAFEEAMGFGTGTAIEEESRGFWKGLWDKIKYTGIHLGK